MTVPPQPTRQLGDEPIAWISLDHELPRPGLAVGPRRSGVAGFDGRRSRANAEACGCCAPCCCCCCCARACEPETPEEPPAVMTVPPTVRIAAELEPLADPTRIAAGLAGVTAVRVELSWRARGQRDARVELEARSEALDGRAVGPWPDWTALVRDRAEVDVAVVTLARDLDGRFCGDVVRLRAKATAATGAVAYSEVVTIRLPA